MSQYDQIGANYNIIKTTLHNRIEKHNIQRVTRPFLQDRDAKVIDFACGTGFYSELLLKWGASRLLGVDISAVMVGEAVERLAATPYADRAKFVQGDGRIPHIHSIDGNHGFDVATGYWLLNYAKDKAELTAMFHSIASNLKDDGVFIGCLMHPTDDVTSYAKAINAHGKFITGIRFHYEREIGPDQGYALQCIVEPPTGEVTSPDQILRLDVYHLPKHTFEEAAKAGGMSGRLEWIELEYLDQEWLSPLKVDEKDKRWQFLKQYPCMAMLVVHKM